MPERKHHSAYEARNARKQRRTQSRAARKARLEAREGRLASRVARFSKRQIKDFPKLAGFQLPQPRSTDKEQPDAAIAAD